MPATEVLDDADLQMMQGMIVISDDEDEDTTMSTFAHLQPQEHEIDLDPSQTLSLPHVHVDKDTISSSSSSPRYFEFPQADDSPPQRREKLLALWQEQDDIVKDLLDGTEEVNHFDDGFPNECDSPRTRRLKLQELWKEEDEYIRSLTEIVSEASHPGSSSSSQMSDTTWPMPNDSPRSRAQKLLEIWREQDRWIDDLLKSPDAKSDPIEQFEEDAAPVRKERPVKYGRCPDHRLPLYPHLHASPHARAWGSIFLRCPNFKKRNSHGKPSCWFSRPLTEEEMKVVPKGLLVAQKKIRADVSWQLRNNAGAK